VPFSLLLDNPSLMESQGNINYCDHPSPVSISPSLVASCKAGGGFHSVLGDREKVNGTFREFIVPCQVVKVDKIKLECE